MSDNSEKIVPFTIRTIYESDRNKFYKLRDGFFGGRNEDAFRKLLESINHKPAVNTEVTDNNNNSEEIAGLREQIKKLQEIISEKDNEITTMQSREPEVKEKEVIKEITKEVQPAPPAFIFTPDADLQKQIRRLFAFMVKEKKVEKTSADFLQTTTRRAWVYFIKNEFPQVLK